MKTILFDSPFVPPEWITAHGLTPRRLSSFDELCRPKAASGFGICPYAQQFLGMVSSPELTGVVFSTGCDQMRRAADVAAGDAQVPVFIFNRPATWQTAGAREMYRSEIDRLGRFFTGLGGQAPSVQHLAEVMRTYAAARTTLQKARRAMSPRAFSEALARLSPAEILERPLGPLAMHSDHEPLQGRLKPGLQPRRSIGSFEAGESQRLLTSAPAVLKAAPVALAGGPLLPLHYEIFEVVEAAGGWIALDATRAGEGSLAPPFDERRLDHDPLPVLVKAYFDGLLDAFRRPNEPFYHWFKAKVLERGIRGILLRHHMWCDLWRAEEQRLREVTGLPVLRLQVGEESQPLPHTINRVQSFLEMLR